MSQNGRRASATEIHDRTRHRDTRYATPPQSPLRCEATITHPRSSNTRFERGLILQPSGNPYHVLRPSPSLLGQGNHKMYSQLWVFTASSLPSWSVQSKVDV